jgi:tetratricopeptide (TPR) repeat protein
MCAKCHARRYQIHEDFRPGKPFMDYYQPVLLNAGLYHADGQIQDEVYEYGSFLQSRMYANRVRCTDCHDPHSLQRKFVGNKMCGQCHLPGKYDTPAHHHHKPESTGAQCVECHMAARYYMVIDKRRDHSFRIPRPDLSVELGTPNACNDCHTKPEESAQWAADAVRTWYGNKRRNDPHWAPAIAAGRQIQPEGEDLLLDAIRRKTTPNIVRATAFDLLSGYSSSASSGARRKALTNADPLIRGTAIRVLADQNLQGYESDLAERLLDPIRDVRISAAVRLAYLPPDRLEFTDREPLRRAILEFRASQELALDHAGAHLTLAGLDRHNRRIQEAVAHLHSAIQLEPYLSGARTELASILDEHRGDKQQIRTLREEETKLLERDTQLAPGQAEIYYQLGLLHYLLGHFDDAALSLEKACELAPMSYDYHMILALLAERRYELSGEKAHLKSAARLLRKLEVIQPGDPRTKGIAERLSATRMAIEARSPGQPSP